MGRQSRFESHGSHENKLFCNCNRDKTIRRVKKMYCTSAFRHVSAFLLLRGQCCLTRCALECPFCLNYRIKQASALVLRVLVSWDRCHICVGRLRLTRWFVTHPTQDHSSAAAEKHCRPQRRARRGRPHAPPSLRSAQQGDPGASWPSARGHFTRTAIHWGGYLTLCADRHTHIHHADIGALQFSNLRSSQEHYNKHPLSHTISLMTNH